MNSIPTCFTGIQIVINSTQYRRHQYRVENIIRVQRKNIDKLTREKFVYRERGDKETEGTNIRTFSHLPHDRLSYNI